MKPVCILPQKWAKAFNYPNLHVYAKQSWHYMGASNKNGFGTQYQNDRFLGLDYESWYAPTIWLGEKVIFLSIRLHSPLSPIYQKRLDYLNSGKVNFQC